MRSIGAALLAIGLVAAAPAGPQAAVAAALADSVAGWNADDLDRYMAVYATDATYVAPEGLVQGKAAITARYRPAFTGPHATLVVRVLAIRTISDAHELVFAQWRLTDAASGVKQGPTTLLFERRKEGWRIIADHSS